MKSGNIDLMAAIFDEFEKSPGPPHDTAFRLAFRKRELAESFFRNYLPREIGRQIDFSNLKTVNKSFVDEKFRQRHSDMIYKARLKERPIFFYLLFEHQSTPERWMPFRALGYIVNFWKDYEDQHPESDLLPLVFPAVFYHGKRKWRSPLNLREMIDGYDAEFDWFTPDFAYRLYDFGRYGEENFDAAGNKALDVVLHLFKHIFDEVFGDLFEETVELAVRIDDQKMFREILEWAVTYFLHARNEDSGELIDVITRQAERIGDQRIRRVVMTAAEQLRRKGIEEGKLIGLREGKMMGLQEGKTMGLQEGKMKTIALLLRQIRKRFGDTSPILEQKLRQSELDTLDRFAESIFDFKDLKEAESWWETLEREGHA